MRRLLASILCSALACGTSPEDTNGDGIADGVFAPNNVTVVTPTKPTGFITGTVYDFTTNLPIAGAQVAIWGAGVTQTSATDSSGAFSFGPIPAARYGARIEAGGFADASISAIEIPSAAGNFPVERGAVVVGPIGLLPTTGTFAVQVISERGEPVRGARVAAETAVRWFQDGAPRGTVIGRGESDPFGYAEITGLIDYRGLPPRLEPQASLVVTVEPIDLDGDQVPDLRGTTVAFAGAEVRGGTRPPVIVVSAAAAGLQLVASNVFRPAPQEPVVLAPGAPIRAVFNQEIDADGTLVDLRDESGAAAIPATAMVTGLGNALEVTPSEALLLGQEYNLLLRVRSAGGNPATALVLSAPFFVARDPAAPFTASATFVDLNGDALWGTGNDAIQIRFSRPIGRLGATPAFVAEIHLALDVNNSGVVGDGAGEMIPGLTPMTAPLLVPAEEPAPENGVPRSGYTRMLAPIVINLFSPLANTAGPIDLQIRLEARSNGSAPVLDPEGQTLPARITAIAPLAP
jgi:hypothetical protein